MTTRNFKIYGMLNVPNSTGTIKVNGNVIFNGTFNGTSDETTSTLYEGEITFDDSVDVAVPVEVTVTSGSINYGLVEWDFSIIDNPIYTHEEYLMFYDTNSTIVSDLVDLMQAKSGTAWTAEQLALFEPTNVTLQQNILMHTQQEGIQQKIVIQQVYNVGSHIRDTNAFSLTGLAEPSGVNPTLPANWSGFLTLINNPPLSTENQLRVNFGLSTRANPLVDDSPVANDSKFITIPAGSTLTYEQPIFSSTTLTD